MFYSSIPEKLLNFAKKIRCRKLILFLMDTVIMSGVMLLMMCLLKVCGEGNPFLKTEVYALNLAFFWILIMGTRFFIAKTYRNVWRYADSILYLSMIVTDFSAGACGMIFMRVVIFRFFPWYYIGMWQMIFLVGMFNSLTLTARFSYQGIYRHLKIQMRSMEVNQVRVAIVGAGQVGSLLARDLQIQPNAHYKPVLFVDTDKAKIGSRIANLPVYGRDEKLLAILNAYSVQEIFITFSVFQSNVEEAISFYSKNGYRIKVFGLPGEESTGNNKVQEIKIEDLLCRETKNVLSESAKKAYENQVILITGGGGSIGSEICRQLAKCNPKQLIIFDIYENNAYEIQQELSRTYGEKLNFVVEIGSVRDRDRLEAVFSHYRPDYVFHAAAHKHVPLMEHSVCEAIKNNVFGTYNVADMAEKYEAKKFIMISTDKAVNPTNVMGATKRLCEMVIRCRKESKTSFSAVRFGNVLGSNGSVIPLFKKQIEEGGPITITDKRIIRYFMTIPEASKLVLQAGAMAKSGELFVLDMGKPIKILDLAENMIRLSGLVPYQDIGIKEIGLRPGEKLYEELLIRSDTLSKTDNDMIFVEKEEGLSREEVDEKLAILKAALEKEKSILPDEEMVSAMRKVVPSFVALEQMTSVAAFAEAISNR